MLWRIFIRLDDAFDLILHEGKVRALGTADEIRNSSDPAVSQFIHGRIEGPLAREPLPEPQPETETDEGSEPQQKESNP